MIQMKNLRCAWVVVKGGEGMERLRTSWSTGQWMSSTSVARRRDEPYRHYMYTVTRDS